MRNIFKWLTASLATFTTSLASGQVIAPSPYGTSVKVNYIRSWDAKAPQTDIAKILVTASVDSFLLTSSYIDGLGREIQTVGKQLSPLGKDVVTPQFYDELGRQPYQYSAFAANNTGGNSSLTDGQFKLNPFQQDSTFSKAAYPDESYFYGATGFEASPLNRVLVSYAPGNNWVGASRGVVTEYLLNTPSDSVRIWTAATTVSGLPTTSGIYGKGQLFKTVSTDEDQKKVIEYKDKEGKVILKKVQAVSTPGTAHVGWLCTYYIYDFLGNLRFVLQPKAVQSIWGAWTLTNTVRDELCFYYGYDNRNRMNVKKVPGSGEVSMVYDTRDRLIMTNDANLRNQQKWMVTLYDGINRPTATYLITDALNYNNPSYHASLAATSMSYPNVGSYTNELLMQTGYDDYANLPSGVPAGTLISTDITSTNFFTSYNILPDVAQQILQSTATRGAVTWQRTKVLGTPADYLNSTSIYDDKGRVIQTKSTNISGGTDVVTTQYDFSGKVLRSHVSHQKSGANAATYLVLTKNSYDAAGRVTSIKKAVNGSAEKTIAQMTYNESGQLKTKKLAPEFNLNAGIESLTYDYNIRGWMLGANRDYAKNVSSTNYFGFDLGYDKTTIGSLGSYAGTQYNGNINGTVWRSKGDGEVRKYDFTYDAVNRLTGADFNQYTSGFNKNAGIDFSMSGLAYDGNGNISSMSQKGWKITGSSFIDQLSYSYTASTNKLLVVTDLSNDNSSKLGDFKYDATSKTSTDYTYDGNGNLVTDNNKKISSISYNHLNLPMTITVTGKGTIAYTYDAAGNKLKKVTTEGSKVTTTLYLYGNYVNDTLQYLPQEEGRIRKNTDGTFTYDYFLKDHLGNVRMVLTEEQQTNYYPAATLEGSTTSGALSMVNWEKQFYTIDNTKITSTSAIAGWSSSLNYPNNNGNPPYNSITSGSYPSNYTVNDGSTSTNMYKTNANSNKTALGFVIKVMAGDVVDIFGKSYYYAPGTSFTNSNSSSLLVSDIFNTFLGSGGNPASGKGVTEPNLETLNSNSYSLPSNLIRGSDGTTSSSPKAYINYILFDEQFRNVGSGFSRVGTSGTVKSHWGDPTMQNIAVPKNGYIYVYVSNESNQDVFFDNLQVVHKRGLILEETHYYPFGLTIAGISSKALAFGDPENKRKYNGIEETRELDLNQFDAFYRTLDPQLGRWWQIDPITKEYENISPYASMYDNPIITSDPLGDEGEDCCGGLISAVEDVLISASGVVNGMLNTGSMGLISTDPLGMRNKLSGDKLDLYNSSVQVGQIAPLLMSGGRGSIKTPSLQHVNGTAIPVPVTLKPILVPISGSQVNNQNSDQNQRGGGKNAQHANQKARNIAKERYDKTKAEYEQLKSKPNKTADDKKQLEKLGKQVKHEKQKMDNTGENHSRKAKGSN